MKSTDIQLGGTFIKVEPAGDKRSLVFSLGMFYSVRATKEQVAKLRDTLAEALAEMEG